MGIRTWFVQFAKCCLEGQKKKVDNPLNILYKTDRLQDEFFELDEHNDPLEELVWDVAEYCAREFDKTITITMIYRTQEEQEDIYGEKYTKKSPHQFWQAVDLRSRDFTDDEIKQLVDYLNNKYDKKNYYDWTAKSHEVNNRGEHFHIQLLVA